MKIIGIVAVAVIVGGCSKKPDKATHDRDCEDMGQAFETLRRAEQAPSQEDALGKEAREKLILTLAKLSTLLCKNDNWAADAIACVKTSHQPKDECFKLLSADQKASIKVKLDLNAQDLQPASAVPPTPDKQPSSGQ
jgi:hypothetical protein